MEGTLGNHVIFPGDRLEDFFSEISWILGPNWLMEGRAGFDHEISNAIIENGFIGIQVESFLRPTENRLLLHNVIVQNMTGIGLFSRSFYIEGTNTVLGNCGGYCMALTGGGYYDFRQSTFANYWFYGVRNTPAVLINNYVVDTNDNAVPLALDFSLGNGIIYGYNQVEFEADMVSGADSLYYLTNCILRTNADLSNTDNYNKILKNEDPLLIDPRENDYRLDTLSPAIGYGDPDISTTVPNDILGNSRILRSDIGAYQFMPGQIEGKIK